MKKLIIGGMVGAAMLVVPLMGTAHADPNNYRGTVSAQGPAVGGARTIAVGAQCGSGAGSGAFAAFGPGNNFAGGADGTQTGLNNSAVCGNRQGNLP
jgi:hypothetical protein